METSVEKPLENKEQETLSSNINKGVTQVMIKFAEALVEKLDVENIEIDPYIEHALASVEYKDFEKGIVDKISNFALEKEEIDKEIQQIFRTSSKLQNYFTKKRSRNEEKPVESKKIKLKMKVKSKKSTLLQLRNGYLNLYHRMKRKS